MKILRLRFSNLNSLRGESPQLDFTVPPLAGSGLFAITGPTGAGKTTILDAITLALYGCAARYGSTKPEQMMSRHTGECYAEVEFACASGTYRSTWQLRRARKQPDGELQQPTRRLVQLPEEIVIAERLRDVDEHIATLTGLDYERFLRSVMLAQGEFAAFLKAGANERTELLEQVTGTAIYRDISQAAYERAKATEQALKDLKLEQGAVKLLTDEERLTRQQEIARITQSRDDLTIGINGLDQRLLQARNAARILREILTLKAEDKEVSAAAQAFAPSALRLAAHRRALPHQLNLVTWLADQQKLQTQHSALKELEEKIPALDQTSKQSTANLTLAQEALLRSEDLEKERRPLFREITELDTALIAASAALATTTATHQTADQALARLGLEIKSCQDQLGLLDEEQKIGKAWQEQHAADAALPQQLNQLTSALELWKEKEAQRQGLTTEYKAQNAILGDLRKKLVTIHQAATTHEAAHQAEVASTQQAQAKLELLLEGQNSGTWETQRHEAEQRWHQLQALTGLQQQRLVLEKSVQEHQAAGLKLTEQLDQLKPQLEAISLQADQAATLVEARRQVLSLAERVQSLESERASLQTGQPCPLCGAIEHPFATQAAGATPEVVHCQQALMDAQKSLTVLQARQQAMRESQASVTASLEASTRSRQELQSQVSNLLIQWAKISGSPTPEDTGELPAMLTQQAERRDFLAARLRDIRSAETALNTARQKTEISLKAVNDQRLALAGLQAEITAAEKQLEEITAKGQSARAQCDAAATKLQNLLAQVHESGPSLAAAAEALTRLQSRSSSWQDHLAKLQEITTRKAGLAASLSEKSAQRLQLQPALQAAAEALEKARREKERLSQRRQEKFGDQVVAQAEQALNEQLAAVRQQRDEAVKAAQTASSQLTHAREVMAAEKVRFESARQEVAATESALKLAAHQDGFENLPALQTALLDSTSAAGLEADERKLHDRRISLQAKQQSLHLERNLLPPEAIADAEKLEALEAKVSDLRNDLATCQGKLGVLTEQISHDDQERSRHASLGGSIEAATRDRDRWGRLNQLIGSANGVSFSKFAQGLTLERLTALANRHLNLLDPRYSLRRDERRPGELEIEIVDHYQADATRSMQSLSGGESFLVSLALALGLSELAGGRSPIDSLFIDEGFGTLDAETLETAMAALENLRATGKTIGVISHVEAMKERIPTQIRVIKTDGGGGRLEVVS